MLDEAIIELKSLLEEAKNCSIAKIEWWLLKNQNNYKYCKENNLSINSEENSLIHLYDKLNKLTELHRFEEYAKKELVRYKSIISKNPKIKEWLIKNEEFASKELACFLIDYLDYSENEEEIYHLLAYRNVEQKFEIFIQRNDFRNLIEYKELFDELYYIKKIYPEGLKRIKEEINNLPKYI